jgi:putative FmdB family regulatory protein
MPIYEYRCTACDHELEALQRFADPQLTTCPVCGKESLTKLLSAAGFQLKGSGWYATDFKNSGSKPAAKASTATATTADNNSTSSDTSDSKAGSDTKTEAKPATETKSVAADKPSGTTGSSTASS